MGQKMKLPVWLDHFLHVPAYVGYKDDDDRVLWINERVATVNGVDRRVVAGCRQRDVWPDTESCLKYDLEALQLGKPTERLSKVKTLTGNNVWVRLRRVPKPGHHVLLMGEDITAEVKLITMRVRELFPDIHMPTDDPLGLATLFQTWTQPAEQTEHVINGEHLSPRQLEILETIARGLSIKEIASEVGISERTVEYHRAQLKRRLQVGSVAELVKAALQRTQED